MLQLPVPRLHRPHDPELDAAAESVLEDRGCWPTDCARLAGEADIIACEEPRGGACASRCAGKPLCKALPLDTPPFAAPHCPALQ